MDSTVDINSPSDESIGIVRPSFQTLKQVPSSVSVCKLKNGNYVLTAHEGVGVREEMVLVEMTKEECLKFARQLEAFLLKD